MPPTPQLAVPFRSYRHDPVTIIVDGTHTFRTRKHGGRSLPLPPLMHPAVIQVHKRLKEPKAKVKTHRKNASDFQKRLSLNPWAHALASPIRQCSVSRARLPSHFLLPFYTKIPPLRRSDTQQELLHPPELLPRIASKLRDQASSYVFATHAAMRQFSHKSQWVMMVNERMKRRWALRAQTSPSQIKVKRLWRWDPDMAAVVLRELQDEALRSLALCLAANAQAAGGVVDDGAACVLQLHHSEQVSEVFKDTLVFNLQQLLAPEQLDMLIEAHSLRGENVVSIPITRQAVDAVLSLQRLHDYVHGIES